MLPCLAQVCTLDAGFESDVADYAAGQCPAIEIWLTKLETYLRNHALDDVRRLRDAHGVAFPVASYQGGLLVGEAERQREHWSHFERRLQICQELEIGTLVVTCDLQGPRTQEELGRVTSLLRQAGAKAAEFGVRLALEFQGKAAWLNNLETAVALVADIAHPQIGVCLDLFHYYTGPSKLEDLQHCTPDNLFHVQLCDLAGVTRELAADADRVLPGDGDFDIPTLIDALRGIGYGGHISVELMNPQIWHVPPLQFGEIGMTALRRALGQAAME